MMGVPDKMADDKRLNKYYWYTPRFWDGMRTRTWWRLMWRHGFGWSPSRLDVALGSLLLLPFHSACYRWQELRGAVPWKQRPSARPLFLSSVTGAGTTFLHELLVLDARHSCPTTYDCF